MQPKMATLSLEDLSRQSPSWVFTGTLGWDHTDQPVAGPEDPQRNLPPPDLEVWSSPAESPGREAGGKAPTFPRGGLSPSQRMRPTSPRGVLGQGLTPLCAQVSFSLTTHQPPRVTGSNGKAWEGFLELGRKSWGLKCQMGVGVGSAVA